MMNRFLHLGNLVGRGCFEARRVPAQQRFVDACQLGNAIDLEFAEYVK
ncbi:hypothetical protein [Spirosoma lituiforme]